MKKHITTEINKAVPEVRVAAPSLVVVASVEPPVVTDTVVSPVAPDTVDTLAVEAAVVASVSPLKNSFTS